MASGTPVRTKQQLELVLKSADLVFPLRDYLRRMGFTADVRSPTVVEVETDTRPDEIEAHIVTWSRVTGVEASVVVREIEQALLVPPPPESAPPRLGELLVQKGMITAEQLAAALTEARATQDLVGRVLLKNQWIFEDELARTLSEQLSLPYLSIMRVGVNAAIARLLPRETGLAIAAIPVRKNGDAVIVAFADPTDQRALAEVQGHLPKIEVAVAEFSDIRSAWRQVPQV